MPPTLPSAAGSLRVVYMTAGAGGMYCGSCMHDNTLVAALKARGRDVTLIPLYTPVRTDEPDVSEACVLYGGINVYLQQVSPLFARLPFGLDRLLDRPGLIRGVLARAGDAGGDPKKLGPLTVSMLSGERGAQKREVRKLAQALAELRPGLVVLPDALFVGAAETLRRELRVPVCCSLTGEDLFLDKLPERYRTEADRLLSDGARNVDTFIALTRYYADYSARRWNIPREKIEVLPPGVRTDDVAPREESAVGSPRIAYLSRLCADKGLHLLCNAFIGLRRAGTSCRLAIGGYLGDLEKPFWEEQERKLRDAGVWEQVEYAGSPDRAGKLALLQSADLFSVPGVYHEAKGLPLLEALAHGVPVVQPAHGSYVEIVEQTGGGLLYSADRPAALQETLQRLIDDAAGRRTLGCRGRAAVLQSFSAEAMADRAWALFERLAGRG